jgi:hypothetical protein
MTAYRINGQGDVIGEQISGGSVWNGILQVDPTFGAKFVVYGAQSDNGTSTIRVRSRP